MLLSEFPTFQIVTSEQLLNSMIKAKILGLTYDQGACRLTQHPNNSSIAWYMRVVWPSTNKREVLVSMDLGENVQLTDFPHIQIVVKEQFLSIWFEVLALRLPNNQGICHLTWCSNGPIPAMYLEVVCPDNNMLQVFIWPN